MVEMGTKKRVYKNIHYCRDCKKLVFLKSRWFRCPICTLSNLTKKDDFTNTVFSSEKLNDILHKNGCFAKEVTKLKHHLINEKIDVFAPELPEGIEKHDLITVIDLAVATGYKYMVLKQYDCFDSLKRRAIAHTGGNLTVITDEISNK